MLLTLAVITAVLFAWPVNGVPSGIIWTVYPAGFCAPGAPLWHEIAYYTLGNTYTWLGIAAFSLFVVAWRRQFRATKSMSA
jgi:hypothetical protein